MVSKQYIESFVLKYDDSAKVQATDGDVGPSFVDNKYSTELRRRSEKRTEEKTEEKVPSKNVFKQKKPIKVKEMPFRI
ncbi:MAG: hypothetical protein KAS32_09245, partial [Candidatus Peribacteraceae bacterium]|nr:hypothetical protein [Candidatus Peribacteraceae bacterium]